MQKEGVNERENAGVSGVRSPNEVRAGEGGSRSEGGAGVQRDAAAADTDKNGKKRELGGGMSRSGDSRESGQVRRDNAGTQFTCFTSTKVRILTPEELRARARGEGQGHHTESYRGGCVTLCGGEW
jgi:hypothetical protein